MKHKKQSQFPQGYCVAIRLQGFCAISEITGEDVFAALPVFGAMAQKEKSAVWKDFCRYLVKRGVSKSRLIRYWRELSIDRNRYLRQRTRDENSDQMGLLNRIRNMPLSPSTFKYDRAVGVEIECYGPRLGLALPMWAREKDDGSLRSGGVEFNLLLKREYLEPRLFRFCQLLASNGHTVDKSCGLHVHLDMRGRSSDDVAKLAKKLDKWLYALRELVPVSRRDNQYCQFGFSRDDRYHAVNFCAFEKFKTLEVRVHSGTCDYTKIVSWIRLIELCSAMPKAPTSKTASSCLQTLESLPLPAHELAYWLARHKELNPRIYNTVSTAREVEN